MRWPEDFQPDLVFIIDQIIAQYDIIRASLEADDVDLAEDAYDRMAILVHHLDQFNQHLQRGRNK